MTKTKESSNERGAQEIPITGYFQEKKNLPEKNAKRIKIAFDEPGKLFLFYFTTFIHYICIGNCMTCSGIWQ